MARLDNSTRQQFLDYMGKQRGGAGFTADQFQSFNQDKQGFAGGFPDFSSMAQQPVQPGGQQNGQVAVAPLPQPPMQQDPTPPPKQQPVYQDPTPPPIQQPQPPTYSSVEDAFARGGFEGMQQFAALQPGPAGKSAIGPPNPNDEQPLIGPPNPNDLQPASPGDRGGVIPGGNIPVSGFVPPDDTFFFPPADVGPNINPQPRFGAPPDLQSPGLNPGGDNPLPGSPANDPIDELLANHPGLNPNRPGQGNDLGSSGSWEMDPYDFESDTGGEDLTLNPDGTPKGVEGITYDPYPTNDFVQPGATPDLDAAIAAALAKAKAERARGGPGTGLPVYPGKFADPVKGPMQADPFTPGLQQPQPGPGGGGGAPKGPVTPGPVLGQPFADPPPTGGGGGATPGPVTPGPVAGQPPATPVTQAPDEGDDWWKKGLGIGEKLLPPWMRWGLEKLPANWWDKLPGGGGGGGGGTGPVTPLPVLGQPFADPPPSGGGGGGGTGPGGGGGGGEGTPGDPIGGGGRTVPVNPGGGGLPGGPGSGGPGSGGLPGFGGVGNPLTKPARETSPGINTARELTSYSPSITSPDILNTVQTAIQSRLAGNVADDPRVQSQLADLQGSQDSRKRQRIEDLKRIGINADDGNYFSEGDKLGESFNRERLNVLANAENLRTADYNTGLNLGNIQGGINTSDAQLGLAGKDLGVRERGMLGGLQLDEFGQDVNQRGQDIGFDVNGARLGLDQQLGLGDQSIRRDESATRSKQLEAQIEDARSARAQANLANIIALLNGNNGTGWIDRGLDAWNSYTKKKDGQ